MDKTLKTGHTTVNPKSPTPPLAITEHTQIGFSQLNNLNKTLECGSPGLEQEGLATLGSSRYL